MSAIYFSNAAVICKRDDGVKCCDESGVSKVFYRSIFYSPGKEAAMGIIVVFSIPSGVVCVASGHSLVLHTYVGLLLRFVQGPQVWAPG